MAYTAAHGEGLDAVAGGAMLTPCSYGHTTVCTNLCPILQHRTRGEWRLIPRRVGLCTLTTRACCTGPSRLCTQSTAKPTSSRCATFTVVHLFYFRKYILYSIQFYLFVF